MLAIIRDDTWNVLNMLHIIPNLEKDGLIQTSSEADLTTKTKQITTKPSRLILGLYPANERRRYNVTPSLIGWEQT